MRTWFFLALLCCTPLFAHPSLFEGLDIRLQEAVYGDGEISTDKGGIITAKDFFLQAKVLQYVRTEKDGVFTHKLTAQGQLFASYCGRWYRGDKAVLDLIDGKLTIWNGCTQTGMWFVSGSCVEVFDNGAIHIKDASITSSENERSDWSIVADSATITKDKKLEADNVSFRFIKIPLFWTPTFSSDLSYLEEGPFRYRVRNGGGEGVRLGMSYVFRTGPCKHRALLDYSFRNGWGTGLVSRYINKEQHAKFDALNYVAQGRGHTWDPLRYRVQGHYTQDFDPQGMHFDGTYDKLSDRGMRRDFSDHALSDPRPGLTQASLWKKEENWLARINGRVRINDFQTVKQELPLFTAGLRTQRLGCSPLLVENGFKTGYLSYVYAHGIPSVHNFASSRTQITQRLYTTYLCSPIALTPSVGYRLIHYSNSPQHDAKLQCIGEIGFEAKTRFVRDGATSQILEPYAEVTCLTQPLVKPGHSYIFDIDDGWDRVNVVKYGARSWWWFPTTNTTFQPRLFTDLYTRSFFQTRHLSSSPYKLWSDTTWDATPWLSWKVSPAWDFMHKRLDHFNVAMRNTLSDSLALVLEWRQRSSYAWRKLDDENYVVDAARSYHRLRHSEMSDARKTIISSIFWNITPSNDIKLSLYQGWRPVHPHRYHYYEISFTTLIRGALRLSVTYQTRPGGPVGFYWQIALGPKPESDTTTFRKIGQGNYDIW
jgi:hypothetical protein